ncbi:MAG: hypothetical protein Q7S98_01205, partial [Deltaproteobacteria bacterium]|nr:hypothetical protein [Deltaproteobacteria bacterium]
QVRPLRVRPRSEMFPLITPYVFRDPLSAHKTNFFPLLAPRLELERNDPYQFLLTFETIDINSPATRTLRTVSLGVSESDLSFHAAGGTGTIPLPTTVGTVVAADPDDPTQADQLREALLTGDLARVHDTVSHSGFQFPYLLVYRSEDQDLIGLAQTELAANGDEADSIFAGRIIDDGETLKNSVPRLAFSDNLTGPAGGERRHLVPFDQSHRILGNLETPTVVPFVPFFISDPGDPLALHFDPAVTYAAGGAGPAGSQQNRFYVVWASLTASFTSEIVGQFVALEPPPARIQSFGFVDSSGTCQPWLAGSPAPQVFQNQTVTLCWETTDAAGVTISADNDGTPPPVLANAIQGDSPLALSGQGESRPIRETGPYFFTLKAINPLGQETTRQVPLIVNPYPLPTIDSFTINNASQVTIRTGDLVQLDWRISVTEGDEVHIHIQTTDGRVVIADSMDLEGFETDRPDRDTTYDLTVTGLGGTTAPQTVTVTVTP